MKEFTLNQVAERLNANYHALYQKITSKKIKNILGGTLRKYGRNIMLTEKGITILESYLNKSHEDTEKNLEIMQEDILTESEIEIPKKRGRKKKIQIEPIEAIEEGAEAIAEDTEKDDKNSAKAKNKIKNKISKIFEEELATGKARKKRKKTAEKKKTKIKDLENSDITEKIAKRKELDFVKSEGNTGLVAGNIKNKDIEDIANLKRIVHEQEETIQNLKNVVKKLSELI